MERQKIENQYKWTIDEMYPSESDLNKDIDKVKELIDKLRESISNINEVTTKLHLNNDVNEFMNSLNTQAQKLTKSEEGFIVIDDLNYDYKIFSAIENRHAIN